MLKINLEKADIWKKWKNNFQIKLSLVYSNYIIEKSKFIRNQVVLRSKNIFLGFSNLYILDSEFEDIEPAERDLAYLNNITGSFIFKT